MPQFRQHLLSCIAAIALAVGHAGVHADDFATKPVRVVVPFSAGGTADVLARLVGEKLQTAGTVKGVIVENIVGAGGGLGADVVYKAPADGLTLLVSSPGPIAINQGLYPKLPYDPTRWSPVAILASVPNALIVSPTLPVKTVAEFVAYAKAHPGRVSYATQGNGTTSHLTAKLFESLTGTRMVQIPYKGDTPALTDLAGGQVDAFFGNVGAAMQLHRSGRIHILAVADVHRAAALPEVPSFAEAGLAGMQSVTWYAVVAPPATPADRRATLNAALSTAIHAPDSQRKLTEMGLEPQGMSLERTAQFITNETARWQKLIKDAEVKLE